MNEYGSRWIGRAAKLFCLSVGIVFLYFAFRYAGGLLLSALLSILTAAIVRPVAAKLSRHTKLNKKLISAICVASVFILFGAAFFLSVLRLVKEFEELLVRFSEDREGIYRLFMSLFEGAETLLDFLPIITKNSTIGGYAEAVISSVLNDILNLIGQKTGEALGALLHSTPRAAMLLLFYAVSTFYLTVDSDRISALFSRLLPASAAGRLQDIKKRLLAAVRQYVRAYLLIFAITFGEVFLGLTVIGTPYPLLMALITSAVDILPVFGSGAILIPWAIFCLATGQRGVGLGLLIIYGVVTVVRQIAEPHIVGGRLGIHPLISFALMIGGGYLFGIAGVVAAPFVAVTVKELVLYKSKKM